MNFLLDSSSLKFDSTITVGNLLMAASFLLALAGGWIKITKTWNEFALRLATVEKWIEEHHRWSRYQQDSIEEDKRLMAKLEAFLEAHDTRIERIERRCDSHWVDRGDK